MMMRYWARFGFALLTVLAAPGFAQITASQGAPAVADGKRFESPMVLSIPLPQLRGQSTLVAFSVAGIREYRCEDASLPLLKLSTSTSKKGVRTVIVSGMLLVDKSYDRFVSLEFALRDGEGEMLARGREYNISVEEEKSARFSVDLELAKERAAELDGAADLRLQVTMHVRPDGKGPWTP